MTDERPIPRPPSKPEPDECCQRGCSPCIFDYYWDALDRWKTLVEARGHDPEAVLRARGEG
ncbi:oxidoreductase-like domain-containing protein [Phenylobacterium sp.]|uniref:oxidoreductase-like domain-containing protein n=1 Tax=Phenylobacterium sp. TaxID=1871053 RepID=UPI0025DE3C6D|nr:oxidoreductase-like domain-containing protein [Phenylobacterium sp.]